jgi:signal transduction histidine kinase
MNRMVTDLLDMTRSRLGGGLPIERRAVDLSAVCAEVMEEVRESHPGRVSPLRVSGNVTGYWDPDRLAQVCTNLLGNALEHGHEGSPITVTLSEHAEGVLLCVENAGEAISETLRPLLFQPFRRGRNARSKGLGLGLFIVDHIARAHGGTVRVLSDERSTRFLVTLPRLTSASSGGSTSGGL